MLYVGLDLSRKRLDWNALGADGESVAAGALPPDRAGLGLLVERVGVTQPVMAVIESMTGARFVRDELERAEWDVKVTDAQRTKSLKGRAQSERDTGEGACIAGVTGRSERDRVPARSNFGVHVDNDTRS